MRIILEVREFDKSYHMGKVLVGALRYESMLSKIYIIEGDFSAFT